MQFSVMVVNDSRALISQRQEYLIELVAFGGAFVFFLGSILAPQNFQCLLPSVIVMVLIGYKLFTKRELTCLINKQTNNIFYKTHGLLGFKIYESDANYEFSDVTHLELKRLVHRWGDRFQLRLGVKGGKRINLSGELLDFSEAAQYAEQIHQFLGREIPLKAVD